MFNVLQFRGNIMHLRYRSTLHLIFVSWRIGKFLSFILLILYTVKLLLSDQLRDYQKAVAEEKVSPYATKEHHTKRSDSIYYALTTHYFQQNPMLLVQDNPMLLVQDNPILLVLI